MRSRPIAVRTNKDSVVSTPDVERNYRVFSDGVGTSEKPFFSRYDYDTFVEV